MKAGLGSRGGHVVRITKGGNAVYGLPAEHENNRAKIAKGAAIVVGSLAGAALLGHAAGRIAYSAAKYENKAKTLEKVAEKGVNVARQAKVSKFAVKHAETSRFLETLHSDVRYAAAAAGTVGASYGGNELLEAKGKKTKRNEALVAGAAAAGSLFAVRLTEYAQLAPTLSDAVKVAGQKIRKPIRRRG